MIDKIRKHAQEHYEEDGWDILVECYEDKDIADIISTTQNLDEAIKLVAARLKPQAEYRADIQAEIF